MGREGRQRGVCCTCQEEHDVVRGREPGGDHDFDDPFYANPADDPTGAGEVENWVMADHDPTFIAVRCDGSGTMPQATYFVPS